VVRDFEEGDRPGFRGRGSPAIRLDREDLRTGRAALSSEIAPARAVGVSASRPRLVAIATTFFAFGFPGRDGLCALSPGANQGEVVASGAGPAPGAGGRRRAAGDQGQPPRALLAGATHPSQTGAGARERGGVAKAHRDRTECPRGRTSRTASLAYTSCVFYSPLFSFSGECSWKFV